VVAAVGGFLLSSALSSTGPQPIRPDTPPVFRDPMRVACGSVLTAFPYNHLAFNVEALDFDLGDLVTLRADELPTGAVSSPAASVFQNPAGQAVEWIPSSSDAGSSFQAAFTAEDTEGAIASCRIEIQVQSNDYVALGDSYSSGEGVPADLGEGLDFIGGGKCHRSIHAYPDVLRRRKRFKYFTFVACSGAPTLGVRSGWHSEPAQLSALRPSTTLVTLTIGGNDIEFAKVVSNCSLRSRCIKYYSRPGPNNLDNKIMSTAEDLQKLYLQVRRRAEHAVIVVLGYPQIFSARRDGGCGVLAFRLGQRRRAWLNEEGRLLNEVIKGAVEAAAKDKPDDPPFVYVDDQQLFGGREACTRLEMVNGPRPPPHVVYSFHPNRAGQTRLADCLLSSLVELEAFGTIPGPSTSALELRCRPPAR
jgi:hypothetical protein